MIILPINEKPPFKSYLHRAYPISVMLANNPDSACWIRSMFLQLYFDTNDPSYKMDFYPIPLYRYECLDDGHIKGCILNEDNIICFSKQLLNNGYYLLFILDEYYIEGTYSYKNTHFDHWIMVHGYDENKLYCVSYLSDRRFQRFTIEYITLLKSVKYVHGIGVYKLVNNFQFDYDFNLANELLYDYINSVNTSKKHRIYKRPNDALYGRDVYQAMIDDLNFSYDYRYTHVLLEHKENVRYWLQFNGVDIKYIKMFNDVIKQCRVLEFLYLKQNSAYNKNLEADSIKLIKNIDEDEQHILKECCNQLLGN